MISITIPVSEWYDETHHEIIQIKKPMVLNMEHSLISISKWESFYKKAFLTSEKTTEEWFYYFYCMLLNPAGIDRRIFYMTPQTEFQRVQEYMADPMTATTISKTDEEKKSPRIMTSEELYCAMSMLNVPYECQKWHINRLIVLLEVCAIRNAPDKKMSKAQTASSWAKTNARNRAKFKSKG